MKGIRQIPVAIGALVMGVAASLVPPPALPAIPDRATIPAGDQSANVVFSKPIEPTGRASVLPPYQFSPQRPAEVLASPRRHHVREIRLSGSTALDDESVRAVVSAYEDRSLSFTELVELRDRVTAHYVDAGYVTSGAVLESLDGGVLTLRVIEGRLQQIRVNETGRLRPRYVAGYIEGFGDTNPVNVFDLERRLQILQQQPQVSLVEAQLIPGDQRGESILIVNPVEAPVWHFRLEASNQLSPAIGSYQGVAGLNLQNLTGRADNVRAGIRAAEGLVELMAEYEFPVGSRGSRLAVYAFGADSDIVKAPFDDLDIEAESFTAGLRLRQPLRRTLSTQTTLTLAAEWRESRTYLLGQGFSFIEGPEEGRAEIALLRGGIEHVRRTQQHVLFGRLEASAGLDGTRSGESDVPDSRFLKLDGQFQWARRVPWLDSQALFRVEGQISNDPLFGLERYPVGGRWTVRGYRENTLIRDNAVVASAEWRVPLLRDVTGRSRLELRPFVDWSYSSNVSGDELGPNRLYSAGLGIYVSPVPPLQMELYWGEALNDVSYPGEYDIQDDGIHFRLTWDAAW